MTPQQKSNSGLALSASDIQELLKDPNSWVAKLYAECQAVSMIAEADFISFLEILMLEEQAEQHQREMELSERAAEAILPQQQPSQPVEEVISNVLPESITKPGSMEEVSFRKAALQQELRQLLSINHEGMTIDQLDTYQTQLMTNLNLQTLNELGPSIILGGGIAISMPGSLPPVISTQKTLARNPGLRKQIAENNAEEGFCNLHTLAATTHLNALNTVQQIENDYGVVLVNTLTTIQFMELIQRLMLASIKTRNENPEAIARMLVLDRLVTAGALKQDQINEAKVLARGENKIQETKEVDVNLLKNLKNDSAQGNNAPRLFSDTAKGAVNDRSSRSETSRLRNRF